VFRGRRIRPPRVEHEWGFSSSAGVNAGMSHETREEAKRKGRRIGSRDESGAANPAGEVSGGYDEARWDDVRSDGVVSYPTLRCRLRATVPRGEVSCSVVRRRTGGRRMLL
jgi:hypothetical protein